MAVDELSRVFAALADPTRRGILQRLGNGTATVGEIARPFPISLPAVSRHLKVLEQAGLITRDKQAQWRTSALRAEPLQQAVTWMEHLNTVWDNRFDRLDVHLERMKQQQRDTETPVEDTTREDDQDD